MTRGDGLGGLAQAHIVREQETPALQEALHAVALVRIELTLALGQAGLRRYQLRHERTLLLHARALFGEQGVHRRLGAQRAVGEHALQPSQELAARGQLSELSRRQPSILKDSAARSCRRAAQAQQPVERAGQRLRVIPAQIRQLFQRCLVLCQLTALLQQLQGSNVELDKRRKELEDRAQLLEARNREIALASASLESKSEELARVSQYKSQFLANMSHEIRTPLNSMMILAQMLSANEDKNLSAKQEEWAATIHSAGRDLLALINQILDLSKVEAGRIETHVEPYALDELRDDPVGD